jgi:hypothetical protein
VAPPDGAVQLKVTVLLVTDVTAAVGAFTDVPAAPASAEPEPSTHAAAAGAAAVTTRTRSTRGVPIRQARATAQPLRAVSTTGIVNVAPWQLLSELLSILTAPVSVKVAELEAGTASAAPVTSVKSTPVASSQAWPLLEVMAPVTGFTTSVTVTGNGFGFVIVSRALPAGPPG